MLIADAVFGSAEKAPARLKEEPRESTVQPLEMPPISKSPEKQPETKPIMSKFNDEDYDDYILFKDFQRRKRQRKAALSKRTVQTPQKQRAAPAKRQVHSHANTTRQIITGTSSRKPPNPWAGCFNYR